MGAWPWRRAAAVVAGEAPGAPLSLGRGGARRRLRGGRRGSVAMVGGGGVGSSGGGCAAVEAAVGLGGDEEGLLIGVARRWSLAGRGWRPASGAGRH